tara:strand:+ start:224 stop:412 length:189 start_codon:yes stop_codon:yes gene_type:complete
MTTENNILNELLALLESARDDNAKFFERDNAAAGTRVRKIMQEVKALAQELRINIQEAKTKQ